MFHEYNRRSKKNHHKQGGHLVIIHQEKCRDADVNNVEYVFKGRKIVE
jgi:hypothetical protein